MDVGEKNSAVQVRKALPFEDMNPPDGVSLLEAFAGKLLKASLSNFSEDLARAVEQAAPWQRGLAFTEDRLESARNEASRR
jgi:hypothetical protein